MASVNVLRGRLYLLASVPSRDGSPGNKRVRIPLRLDDTPVNQRTARKQLQVLERQLANGTFSWAHWSGEPEGMTWREAIQKLYTKKVVLGRTGATTWEINYMGRLRQLPPASLCTTESIAAALHRYERTTCSYKELYFLMKHIALLAGAPFPEVPIPTYRDSAAIEVPNDEQIVAWVEAAPDPSAWYWGMMACYGLRPHEIETAELIDRDYCQVQDKTKTGFRTVIPVHREWVERFRLRDRRLRPRLSQFTERPDQVSKWLSKELRRLRLPWRPYALRHAYAARLWREGGNRLDIFTAARLMGHSPSQHAKVYRAHIQPHSIAEAAERALLGT